MTAWIAAHMGDIVVLAVLGLIIGIVIASMVRAKKKGKGCCGCAMAGSCHGKCQ